MSRCDWRGCLVKTIFWVGVVFGGLVVTNLALGIGISLVMGWS